MSLVRLNNRKRKENEYNIEFPREEGPGLKGYSTLKELKDVESACVAIREKGNESTENLHCGKEKKSETSGALEDPT